MRAMRLEKLGPIEKGSRPLTLRETSCPSCGEDEVLLRVIACGVCHTELDEIEGRTPPPNLPIVPGHQVVGEIVELGVRVQGLAIGARVGVAWIASSCGNCEACLCGLENLCPDFQATGRDRNGGYAESMTAKAAFVYPIPEGLNSVQVAPLLCAGAIGYRSLQLTQLKDGQRLGLMGFGTSARIVLKLVQHRFPDVDVVVFARSELERQEAVKLGAAWAGDTNDQPPQPLNAVIDTTPAWAPVVAALGCLAPGGRLVINAIRKEPRDVAVLSTLSYERHLWMEKEIKSVANVTRPDVAELLKLAADMNLALEIEEFSLTDANRALVELRTQPVVAPKVLVMLDR